MLSEQSKFIVYVKAILVLSAIMLAILLGTSACNSNQTTDSKVTAEDRNEAKFETKGDQRDAQFLVNAAEINLEFIHLGKQAQLKGTTSHLRDLGRMMENHHQKSMNELTILAKSKVMSIPTTLTDKGNDSYNTLNAMNGKDFDKAYAELTASKHRDAISMFEKASTERTDADIRSWAVSSLHELRKHLDSILAYRDLSEKSPSEY